VDPNRSTIGTGDFMGQGDDTTFAHNCSRNRVTYNFNGTTMYVMNISSPSLQSRYLTFIANQRAQGHFDLLYQDDSAPMGLLNPSLFAYGLPCGYNDADFITAEQNINNMAPLPIIFNGLGALNGHDVSTSIQLLDSPNTIGGNYEHCYTDNSSPKVQTWAWQAMENSELQVGARGKLFVCQGRNTNTASSQTDARLYALASFLLTYNPQTSIAWNEFSTPSGLHVMPESQLVLTNPRTPTPSSISGLLTSTGVYAREYANCYIGGQFVNSCAVVVNSDTSSHTFPLPQYQHSLVISGSGVIDGGTISTNGPPPPLSMSPTSATIVFP